MSAAPGHDTAAVPSELAAALRRVAALYYATPEAELPPVGADDLDAEIDAALLAGDATHLRVAVARWEEHWTAQLRPC